MAHTAACLNAVILMVTVWRVGGRTLITPPLHFPPSIISRKTLLWTLRPMSTFSETKTTAIGGSVIRRRNKLDSGNKVVMSGNILQTPTQRRTQSYDSISWRTIRDFVGPLHWFTLATDWIVQPSPRMDPKI